MIKLDVDPWCEDCTSFEPCSKTTSAYSNDYFKPYKYVDTTVQCENRELCHKLINYLKERGGGMNKTIKNSKIIY